MMTEADVQSLVMTAMDRLDVGRCGGLVDDGCGQLTSCPELTCIGKCGIKFKAEL